VLVWLSVWSEVQIACIWSSWCHCIPKPLRLLPHLNPDWFYFSGNGLPRLSLKWVLVICTMRKTEITVFWLLKFRINLNLVYVFFFIIIIIIIIIYYATRAAHTHMTAYNHIHQHTQNYVLRSTRSSAIAEGPRDASCQLKSCQLPRNSAQTTYTTSPDQIDGMKLEI